MKNSYLPKLIIGIIISIIFLYLTFLKIEYNDMIQAFSDINFIYIIPAIIIIFFGHWLRAIRWQYFMLPLQRIPVNRLFSALIIGYMANSILPAHLGEFVRAYVIGKKGKKISPASAMATIFIERIIDLFSLIIIMIFVMIVYPFPLWVKKSGYIMFCFCIVFFIFIYLLKKNNEKMMILIRKLLFFLPQGIYESIEKLIISFTEGIKKLNSKKDYFVVTFLTIIIWACYWLYLHLFFYAYNLFETYETNAISSLVLLVITTISIIIPSSPGYVGTYHYLCQLSLELFKIPRALGLSFAIVTHAVNIIPITLIGFLFAWKEGINIMNFKQIQNLLK